MSIAFVRKKYNAIPGESKGKKKKVFSAGKHLQSQNR